MQWTSKTPTPGTRRGVTHFAWLPVPCDNDKVVWLEKYNAVEVYIGQTPLGQYWEIVSCTARDKNNSIAEGE